MHVERTTDDPPLGWLNGKFPCQSASFRKDRCAPAVVEKPANNIDLAYGRIQHDGLYDETHLTDVNTKLGLSQFFCVH